jgi:hypothetical protein
MIKNKNLTARSVRSVVRSAAHPLLCPLPFFRPYRPYYDIMFAGFRYKTFQTFRKERKERSARTPAPHNPAAGENSPMINSPMIFTYYPIYIHYPICPPNPFVLAENGDLTAIEVKSGSPKSRQSQKQN